MKNTVYSEIYVQHIGKSHMHSMNHKCIQWYWETDVVMATTPSLPPAPRTVNMAAWWSQQRQSCRHEDPRSTVDKKLVLSWTAPTLYLSFFNMYRYGSIPNEHLNLSYVLNIGHVSTFCIPLSHWVLNWAITAIFHSIRKFYGSLVISIPWFMISSFSLLPHVVNPM